MGKTKRQYALYRRPTKNGRAIYYCRFRDGDDGLYLTAVSTGLAKRRDAEAWAIKQLKDHNVATRLSLTFAGFAEGWWTDTCSYVRSRRARGYNLSPGYLAAMRTYVNRHLIPAFGLLRLSSITTQVVED